MPWIRAGVRRLFTLPVRSSSGARVDADDELQAFLAERIDSLVAAGMSAEDARAEALRRLGGSIDETRVRLHRSVEQRERRIAHRERLHDAAQDVRYAVRGLRRTPGFTAVAVLTIAIGVGATTAIFGAVQALILRPLPFPDPQALMSVSLTTPPDGETPAMDDMPWSHPKFLIFRDGQTVFGDLALYTATPFNLTGPGAERVNGELVGARYLHTLGVRPQLGRDFDAALDGQFGAPPQVIISDAFWRRRFSADPRVIGRTIELGRAVEIVGVTPPWFRGLSGDAELFLPIAIQTQREVGGPFAHQFNLVARRKPGMSERAAKAEVAVLGARIDAELPGSRKGSTVGWGAIARPLDDTRLAPIARRALLVLFGAVALVLLIACVNLANLLLGRASARRREVAIRLALGARRGRLVRLFLAESIVLALAGAAAAVLVAWWGIALLRSIDPSVLASAQRVDTTAAVGLSSIRLDATTFLFLFAVTLGAGVVFGLSSAAGAVRASVTGALADNGSTPAGRRRFGGRRALVVAEVALAIVLLAGSGLMVRSLGKLLAIDPGFDARNVLTAKLTIPQGALARDSQPVFYGQLVERLGALPGVQAVGLTNCVPLSGICNFTRMTSLEGPPMDPSAEPGVGVRWATPGYFAAMRVPLRRGRLFGDADRLGAPKVVLLSETAARRYWPSADPIGSRVSVRQGGFADGAEVIGIVGDVRTEPDSAPKPDVYLPYAQSPQPGVVVFVRTSTGATSLAAPVRRTMQELAPEYPVFDIRTMAARVGEATARPRFAAIVLGAFAAVALALAMVGIYGVMSFVVGQRTREIGVRMALGARRSEVLRLVVGEGLTLAGAGAVLGLAGAFAFTRVLGAMLFDVSPSDPATYATIVALCGLAALAASWLPARRATRVDPVVALRAE